LIESFNEKILSKIKQTECDGVKDWSRDLAFGRVSP
jgi:hypothetical protein